MKRKNEEEKSYRLVCKHFVIRLG